MTFAGNDETPRSIEMKVKTRGLFRLKECRFPPLRINLPKDSLEGTVFDGHDKIKLVSHCRDRDSEEAARARGVPGLPNLQTSLPTKASAYGWRT